MTPEEREKWQLRYQRVQAHQHRLLGELTLGKEEVLARDAQFHERIDLQLRVYTVLRRALVAGRLEGANLFAMLSTDHYSFSMRLQNPKGLVTVSLFAKCDRTKWPHWSSEAILYREDTEDKRAPQTWKSVFEDEAEQDVVDWVVRRLGKLEEPESGEEA
jgi:hypothetical protein